jgi:hypothetical protein
MHVLIYEQDTNERLHRCDVRYSELTTFFPLSLSPDLPFRVHPQ